MQNHPMQEYDEAVWKIEPDEVSQVMQIFYHRLKDNKKVRAIYNPEGYWMNNTGAIVEQKEIETIFITKLKVSNNTGLWISISLFRETMESLLFGKTAKELWVEYTTSNKDEVDYYQEIKEILNEKKYSFWVNSKLWKGTDQNGNSVDRVNWSVITYEVLGDNIIDIADISDSDI